MDYQPLFYLIERILSICGGIFFAYLGYKLFLFGVGKGVSKFETGSKFFKIAFSGTGPGLLFMAFGGMVLAISQPLGLSRLHDADLVAIDQLKRKLS
jgi:hypothetical protein